MTYGKHKRFGFHIERAQGSDRKWYLTAIVWVPKASKPGHHRYFYPSMPWF